MTHTIINQELRTELSIIENKSDISIHITWILEEQTMDHKLSKKDLHDLIGVLLHVQSKMRK